jgi:hypothetical protein
MLIVCLQISQTLVNLLNLNTLGNDAKNALVFGNIFCILLYPIFYSYIIYSAISPEKRKNWLH